MNKQFKLGFMPTRRAFFSKDEAFKYKGIIVDEMKQLIPSQVEIIDLEWLNNEGLLYDDRDSGRVADYFQSRKIDALFAPHCNFGCENAVAQVASRVRKPFLL